MLGRAEAHPGIDSAGPVRACDHRVEVQLGDFWQVIGQARNPQQDVGQRAGIDGLGAAVT